MSSNGFKVIVRGCHNFSPFNRMITQGVPKLPPEVETGLLPCSSKIEAYHVLKFFERGADGILILACPFGDCRLLEGNSRAAKRVAYAATWLSELGLEASRVKFLAAPGETREEIFRVIEEFYYEIKEIGPKFSGGPLSAGGKEG